MSSLPIQYIPTILLPCYMKQSALTILHGSVFSYFLHGSVYFDYANNSFNCGCYVLKHIFHVKT